MIEDIRGDLVDISYYCSSFCFERDTGELATGNWYPGVETDYDIHCEGCGELIQKGISDA